MMCRDSEIRDSEIPNTCILMITIL